jgi:hypothetical protein
MTDPDVYPRIFTRRCKASDLPNISHQFFLRPPDQDEDVQDGGHGWRRWRWVDDVADQVITNDPPDENSLRLVTVKYRDGATHVCNFDDDVEIAVPTPSSRA